MRGYRNFGRNQRAAMLVQAMMLGATMGGMTLLPGQVQAQSSAERQFDIPAQPLGDALMTYGRQSGVQTTAEGALVEGRTSSAVSGRMTPAQALSRLLAGSGLTFRYLNPRAVRLEAAPQGPNGSISLGPVRVEGSDAVAVEGGTDGAGLALTMTENSKSLAGRYAQVGGKSATLLREIPRSVSVLTAQEIEDKNIVNITQALDQITGITVESYDQRTPVFYSRGFLVQNLTIDGGSPMRMHNGLGSIINGVGLPNLLAYDHVEVLRGADGLYSGNGDASATVNLVRKRPTDHFQAKGALYAGSFNNYRGELDIGGPLNKSGTLRARGVIGIQDAKSYFRSAYTKDKFFYGIAEWDAGPHTTLTVGASYDDLNMQKYERTLAWRSGSLGLPENQPIFSIRDSWMPPWAYDKAGTLQVFAKVSHDFNKDWNLTANITRNHTTSDELYGYYSLGGLNSDDANPSGIFMQWYSHGRSHQTMGDATLKGAFNLLGQKHDIVIGGNYSRSDANYTSPIGYISGVTLNQYLTYYRNHTPTPEEISTWSGYGEWGGVYGPQGWVTSRYGVYGTLGLRLADPLKVTIGGRYSRNGNFYGHWVGKFMPYAAATYDVAKDWTLFASYSETYEPILSLVPVGKWNADPSLITYSDKPTTGVNYEAGVKGDLADGRLQATLSGFYIRKSNVYTNDETQGPVVIPGLGTTYMQRLSRLMTSTGFDAEVKGELTRDWQVSLGYTFNVTHNDEDGGEPILLWTPKHSARLWTTYQLPGALKRVKIGGGMRIFGDSYIRKGYNVINASLDYTINKHFTLGATIDNLGDTTYRTSSDLYVAAYGVGRNFMVTLRGKY